MIEFFLKVNKAYIVGVFWALKFLNDILKTFPKSLQMAISNLMEIREKSPNE